MGPEQQFFRPPGSAPVGVAPPPRVMARGGALQALASPRHFVSHGTGAGGREDNIDAKLSENEYVVDAETVALLGDGSPEAGAKKLDKMRAGIRAHKGRALAAGKISPDAGGALQYLAEGGKVSAAAALMKKLSRSQPPPKRVYEEGRQVLATARDHAGKPTHSFKAKIEKSYPGIDVGDGPGDRYYAVRSTDGKLEYIYHKDIVDDEFAEGGKVGALRALFRVQPKADPNAHLLKLKGVLDAALANRGPPRPRVGDATPEELAADVEALRREVGAQGGDTRPLRRASGGKVGTIEKALGRPSEGPLYHVIDRVTKEVMSKNPMSLKIARRRVDGLDNAYGSYRYTVRRVGDDSEGGN